MLEVLVLRQPRQGLATGVKAMAKAVAARTEHIRRVASVGEIGWRQVRAVSCGPVGPVAFGRLDKAREAFAAALECPLNAAERAYLERKLAG
jgi:hypothetical protein